MFKKDPIVVLHQGVYKKTLGISSAVFMITGMTIGAGILGIPYVVAQVGLLVGLAYILFLGIVMLSLNLMVGEITVRTKDSYQLPGLAGKYLGKWAKVLRILVIGIILGLSLAFLPHVQVVNLNYFNWSKFFLPFGVILFALHAAPSIAEAHALLPNSQRHFRKALIVGTLIPIFVYIIFALAVVGVMGKETTEIATLGLGSKFGSWVRILANVFAVFAMGTGFMGLGIALKQTLVWDWKVSSFLATFLVILGVVGGLFLGVEAILMTLMYWKAKKVGDLPADRYSLPAAGLLTFLVLAVFTVATVVSIIKLINL